MTEPEKSVVQDRQRKGEVGMDTEKPISFELKVIAEDEAEEALDQMTRNLMSELRELQIESAQPASAEAAPQGSKGDPAAIGSIVLESLPTVLPAVIALVQAWIARGQGRTVKFKGKGIEFEGSPEELQKLLISLEKGKKKR